MFGAPEPRGLQIDCLMQCLRTTLGSSELSRKRKKQISSRLTMPRGLKSIASHLRLPRSESDSPYKAFNTAGYILMWIARQSSRNRRWVEGIVSRCRRLHDTRPCCHQHDRLTTSTTTTRRLRRKLASTRGNEKCYVNRRRAPAARFGDACT